jgi:hypothetical protein
VVFVALKRSNALHEMLACSEILLEQCPAGGNVLSDAGTLTILNGNIEMCLLSGILDSVLQPFNPNAHIQFLSCRNGNRKVRFNKEQGVEKECLQRRDGMSHYK